jgi:hypothetical protein
MAHVESGRIVETAVEARGAVRGVPVLYMLVFGTAGVMALFAVIYIYFFA